MLDVVLLFSTFLLLIILYGSSCIGFEAFNHLISNVHENNVCHGNAFQIYCLPDLGFCLLVTTTLRNTPSLNFQRFAIEPRHLGPLTGNIFKKESNSLVL